MGPRRQGDPRHDLLRPRRLPPLRPDNQSLPDVQIHFVPGIGPHPDGVKAYELLGKDVHHGSYGYTIQVINCRPKAAGSVRLVSADPAVAPAITCNYLSREEDLGCNSVVVKFSADSVKILGGNLEQVVGLLE